MTTTVSAPESTDRRARPAFHGILFTVVLLFVLALTVVSLFVGPYDVSISTLFSDPNALLVFLAARVPRTVALLLCGVSLSIAGLIMQLITQNKFVEPSTAGSMQAAILGILAITLLWPDAPIVTRMIVASLAAFAGTLLFLGILRRVSLRNAIIVPLVGIMVGTILGAIAQFIALKMQMQQMLDAWVTGGFADVMRGRYELLWIVGGLAVLAYLVADRLSVAGLGEDIATNVGLNYRTILLFGTLIVAIVSGVTISVVGALPFIGLIVPNIVSATLGDNARRSMPWVALIGAGLVVGCDIVARCIIAPGELPVASILAVLGAFVFVFLILRQTRHVR